MKNLTLIIFITFSGYILNAQALILPGAEWFCDYYGQTTSGVTHLLYNADTLILDSLTHIVTSHTQANDIIFPTTYSWINKPYFIYSNEDQVFHFIRGEFKLLYDLTAEVGDTLVTYARSELEIECDSTGFSLVDSVGVMNMNGLDIRFIRLVDGENSPVSYNGYVFERIGPIGTSFISPQGSFIPFVNFSDCEVVDQGNSHAGFKCYIDDNYFYSKQDTLISPCEFQPVGIEEIEKQSLKIYPNPGEGEFFITLPENSVSDIVVYDALGKVAAKKDGISTANYKLNLSEFDDGMYFVNLQTRNGDRYFSKIIKR